jgi:hypothetical protein
VIGRVVFLLSVAWVDPAHAQFAAGTTWVRTDAAGKGIILTIEACCNGGLRLIYHLPPMGNQPSSTLMTVDSPLDGSEVPALVAGKPSGETMALKRVDAQHYSAIVKMQGQASMTFNATVAADGKTMTVEGVPTSGPSTAKITETWVRK